MKSSEQVECCANYKYLIDYPKGNKYRDVEHFCVITGYFTHAIHKEGRKIKRFTPGGRELECRYERKS